MVRELDFHIEKSLHLTDVGSLVTPEIGTMVFSKETITTVIEFAESTIEYESGTTNRNSGAVGR